MPLYDHYTNAELLPLLQAGDRDAFGVVYDRHFRALYAYVRRWVRDGQVGEDLVQELFVDLWNRREQLHGQSILASYLYRAARNSVISHLRKETVRSQYAAEFMAITQEGVASTEVARMATTRLIT